APLRGASCRLGLLLEQLGQGELESRKHIASLQRVGAGQDADRDRRVVIVDLGEQRIDYPDALDAGREVILELSNHFIGRIGRTDDLDRQVGYDLPGWRARNRLAARPALKRDEC